jgi:hypothetical protein
MVGDTNCHMEKSNKIILTVAVFALLAVVGGGIMSASAATNSTTGKSGFHFSGFLGKNKTMTADQKTAFDAKIKAAQTAQAAKQAAIDAAITASDYNAWVKAVGDKSPLLKKITASNFSQYVQAENLMKQARAIYQQLGINQGEGLEKGKLGLFPNGSAGPRGHGFGRGFNATSTER